MSCSSHNAGFQRPGSGQEGLGEAPRDGGRGGTPRHPGGGRLLPGPSGCRERSWPQACLGHARAPADSGRPVSTQQTSADRQWWCVIPGEGTAGEGWEQGKHRLRHSPQHSSLVRGGHQPRASFLKKPLTSGTRSDPQPLAVASSVGQHVAHTFAFLVKKSIGAIRKPAFLCTSCDQRLPPWGANEPASIPQLPSAARSAGPVPDPTGCQLLPHFGPLLVKGGWGRGAGEETPTSPLGLPPPARTPPCPAAGKSRPLRRPLAWGRWKRAAFTCRLLEQTCKRRSASPSQPLK